MNKFVKKPIVVEAVQWNGSLDDLKKIGVMVIAHDIDENGNPDSIFIGTLEGIMKAARGDWIIKGIRGKFYPCKPDIFEETYEPFNPITLSRAEYEDWRKNHGLD